MRFPRSRWRLLQDLAASPDGSILITKKIERDDVQRLIDNHLASLAIRRPDVNDDRSHLYITPRGRQIAASAPAVFTNALAQQRRRATAEKKARIDQVTAAYGAIVRHELPLLLSLLPVHFQRKTNAAIESLQSGQDSATTTLRKAAAFAWTTKILKTIPRSGNPLFVKMQHTLPSLAGTGFGYRDSFHAVKAAIADLETTSPADTGARAHLDLARRLLEEIAPLFHTPPAK